MTFCMKEDNMTDSLFFNFISFILIIKWVLTLKGFSMLTDAGKVEYKTMLQNKAEGKAAVCSTCTQQMQFHFSKYHEELNSSHSSLIFPFLSVYDYSVAVHNFNTSADTLMTNSCCPTKIVPV